MNYITSITDCVLGVNLFLQADLSALKMELDVKVKVWENMNSLFKKSKNIL